MGAWQTWLVPDLRVMQSSRRSRSAVVELSWLLHYLELVKSWTKDNSGTGH